MATEKVEKVYTHEDEIWLTGYNIFEDGTKIDFMQLKNVSYKEVQAYYEKYKGVPISERLNEIH